MLITFLTSQTETQFNELYRVALTQFLPSESRFILYSFCTHDAWWNAWHHLNFMKFLHFELMCSTEKSSEILAQKKMMLYWWVLLLALSAAQSLWKLVQLSVRRMCTPATAMGPPRNTAIAGCLTQWVLSLQWISSLLSTFTLFSLFHSSLPVKP